MKELLEKYGRTVECDPPFNIKHEDTNSIATNYAANIVFHNIENTKLIDRLLVIKNSYQHNLINKAKFVDEIIKTLEK